ncbi:microtubule-associated serine/threonine-protein kinase 3-like isoform 2-T2 [Anomaloglossus baeobatrachus]
MSDISPDRLHVLALLQGILTTYTPDYVLPLPDGVLSFTYRLVMELVKDCLTKYNQGRISSEYLEHLKKNIMILVQQAEERSQSGDLAFFKQLAQNVLYVLEYLAHSPEHLETPEDDSKVGQSLDIADPNISQLGLKNDPIKETTEPANADGGICETPEIHKATSVVIGSFNPMIKPCKTDFNLIKPISSGSFGTVELVRHKDTEKIFAMKKLARRDLDDQSLQLTYLERDISIFSDCPFVISMFCSFATNHHLCMVMEFAAGGDCGNLIKYNGPLPLPVARVYLAETVLAVEYLHSFGVVHRDLKPENLLISPTGHIKVTDFGLSKLGLMRPTSDIYKAPIEDITQEFRDVEVYGTPCYIAPEVILQKGYGRPIDWWAVGIILHKFLVGTEPFTGFSKDEFIYKILRSEISWDYYHSVPPRDARDMINKLLIKNPAERLGTGGANEIKSHPFLSDLDFENLHSQQSPYIPYLESELDTDYCEIRAKPGEHLDSEESDDGEDIDWPESLNFVSSSQRLSKLYPINTRIMINRDHKSSPDCSLETSRKHSDVQEESSPSATDDDNQCLTAVNKSSSPTSSGMINGDHKLSPDCSLETSRKHSDVQEESSSATDDDNQCLTADNKSSSPTSSGMINGDHKSSPDCTLETSRKHSDVCLCVYWTPHRCHPSAV